MVSNGLRDDFFFGICFSDSRMVKWGFYNFLPSAVCHRIFRPDNLSLLSTFKTSCGPPPFELTLPRIWTRLVSMIVRTDLRPQILLNVSATVNNSGFRFRISATQFEGCQNMLAPS